jgi:nucleoside phosphorylase
MSSLDVLLVTALPMEFEAARQVATSTGHGAPGIMSWEENDRGTATPYMVGDYITYDGASMKVGLARPTRMGGKSTAFLATSLVGRLHPRCLAMCGVCAGNPADLALGDVIIAEMTYSYDEGKRSPGKFEGDHRQTPLHDDAWLRAFQELRPDGLPSYGVASERDADLWLLERLYYGVSPQHHPARDRYFPQGKWRKRVHELEADGRIFRIASKLQLTEKGRDFVDSSLVYDVDPPIQLPFAIKVGPIASGNAVVKDGVTWDVLKGLGVRSVLGLEMEAATIGDAARLNSTPWVVVKGVMDHADPAKDDRYKPFAARASAEVLFKFLVSQDAKLVSVPDLKPSSPSTGPSTVDGHATKAERDYVCSRAFVSIIQALFDAQYYIPDINTEIELYRASMFIPDALLAEIRPNMRQNAPLEEVARQLVTTD